MKELTKERTNEPQNERKKERAKENSKSAQRERHRKKDMNKYGKTGRKNYIKRQNKKTKERHSKIETNERNKQ